MNRYMKLHDKVLSDRTVHHEPWKTVTLGTYRKSKEYLAALQTAPFNLGGLWMVEMISQMPISREKVEVNLAIASLRQLGFIWRDRPLSPKFPCKNIF